MAFSPLQKASRLPCRTHSGEDSSGIGFPVSVRCTAAHCDDRNKAHGVFSLTDYLACCSAMSVPSFTESGKSNPSRTYLMQISRYSCSYLLSTAEAPFCFVLLLTLIMFRMPYPRTPKNRATRHACVGIDLCAPMPLLFCSVLSCLNPKDL